MTTRCLLCDGYMPQSWTAAMSVPLKEDPDAICPTCRALAPEQRRDLRERAMTRMLRRELEPDTK